MGPTGQVGDPGERVRVTRPLGLLRASSLPCGPIASHVQRTAGTSLPSPHCPSPSPPSPPLLAQAAQVQGGPLLPGPRLGAGGTHRSRTQRGWGPHGASSQGGDRCNSYSG